MQVGYSLVKLILKMLDYLTFLPLILSMMLVTMAEFSFERLLFIFPQENAKLSIKVRKHVTMTPYYVDGGSHV